MSMTREDLGRLVRETWVQWAREQPFPKPSWLVPWEQLGAEQREVDMRIAAAVWERCAQLAESVRATYADTQPPGAPVGDGHYWHPFAALLREAQP